MNTAQATKRTARIERRQVQAILKKLVAMRNVYEAESRTGMNGEFYESGVVASNKAIALVESLLGEGK